MNETEFVKAFVPAYMATLTAHVAVGMAPMDRSIVDARDIVMMARVRFQLCCQQFPAFFVDTRHEGEKETPCSPSAN